MFIFWKGNGEAKIGRNRELRKTGELVVQLTEAREGAMPIARGILHLSPGINEVSDENWEMAKGDLALELDAGLLREETIKTKGGKPASCLADLDIKAAIDLVKQCQAQDTLYRWYRDDGRDLVQSSILKRCNDLEIEAPTDKFGVSAEAIRRAEKKAAFEAE